MQKYAYQCPCCLIPLIPQQPVITRLAKEGLVGPLKAALEQDNNIGEDYFKESFSAAVKNNRIDVVRELYHYLVENNVVDNVWIEDFLEETSVENPTSITFDMAICLISLNINSEAPEIVLKGLIKNRHKDFRRVLQYLITNYPDNRLRLIECCFPLVFASKWMDTIKMFLEAAPYRNLIEQEAWYATRRMLLSNAFRTQDIEIVAFVLRSFPWKKEDINRFFSSNPVRPAFPLSHSIPLCQKLLHQCKGVLPFTEDEFQEFETKLLAKIRASIEQNPEGLPLETWILAVVLLLKRPKTVKKDLLFLASEAGCKELAEVLLDGDRYKELRHQP